MTDDRIDPDIWVLIQTVIGAVGALAAVASASQTFRHPRLAVSNTSASFKEMFHEEIISTIRTVERLIRFLSHCDLGMENPLQQRFEFGAAPMMLDGNTFGEYLQLASRITMQLEGSTKQSVWV